MYLCVGFRYEGDGLFTRQPASIRIANSDILRALLHRELFYGRLGFAAHNACLFLIPQRNVDLRRLFAKKRRESSPNI